MNQPTQMLQLKAATRREPRCKGHSSMSKVNTSLLPERLGGVGPEQAAKDDLTHLLHMLTQVQVGWVCSAFSRCQRQEQGTGMQHQACAGKPYQTAIHKINRS